MQAPAYPSPYASVSFPPYGLLSDYGLQYHKVTNSDNSGVKDPVFLY